MTRRIAKKEPGRGGICVLLDEANQRDALAKTELTEISMAVAACMAERFAGIGITPLELRDADARFVRTHCSVVM